MSFVLMRTDLAPCTHLSHQSHRNSIVDSDILSPAHNAGSISFMHDCTSVNLTNSVAHSKDRRNRDSNASYVSTMLQHRCDFVSCIAYQGVPRRRISSLQYSESRTHWTDKAAVAMTLLRLFRVHARIVAATVDAAQFQMSCSIMQEIYLVARGRTKVRPPIA